MLNEREREHSTLSLSLTRYLIIEDAACQTVQSYPPHLKTSKKTLGTWSAGPNAKLRNQPMVRKRR